MDKCIKFQRFLRYLLDDDELVEKGARIIRALLEAQSPRLSDISEKMTGKSESRYKEIQRFLKKTDLKQSLLRLYQEEAEFVIGDPTEMKRYKAPKTSYVGTLQDGITPGYWMLVLSTPFRGRSLPFSFVIYSSRTIAEQSTSRNQEHYRCFNEIQQLLGDRPLVLDREFCYEELLEILSVEGIQFVIRLKLGEEPHQPRLVDGEGKPVKLFVRPGETVIRDNLYYLGRVKVNLIGYWRKSLSKPLWIVTSLDPQRGLEIYLQRMKIEQTFRDGKDLLRLSKLMNKKQCLLEQMIALVLLAYVVGVWLGEAMRDMVYGQLGMAQVSEALLHQPRLVDAKHHPKWLLYSGLFVLLKQKLRLPKQQVEALTVSASAAFGILVLGNVRSFV